MEPLLIAGIYSLQKPMLDLLEGWLRHKSDMVNFEAARAICEMRNVDTSKLSRAISGEGFHPLVMMRQG